MKDKGHKTNQRAVGSVPLHLFRFHRTSHSTTRRVASSVSTSAARRPPPTDQALIEYGTTPDRNYYGYGWGITTMPAVGRRVIFMNGRFAGFTASIHRFPDNDVCLIVLANLEDLDPIRLSREIAGIVFAGKP